MTVAVSSSTAAAYVAPVSSVPAAADADPNDQATPPNAAPPLPSGTPALSDDAMAALVAQQAADSPTPASTTPPAAPDPNHVQIPPAVLANMKAFETTSPTAYTDQIGQYAATINDAKASDQDRLNAWTTLNGLLYSGTIYKAGNLADFQTALDATQTSGYAKSLMQLQNQFHTANVINADTDRAKGVYGPQPVLDTLNGYSQADQQKLFVLMGLNQSYSDLDSMKADYQQVADTYAATGVLTKGTRQISGNAAPAPALAAAATSTTDQGAAVALKTMQSISDQIAAARAGQDDGILSLFKGLSSQAADTSGTKTAVSATA